MMPTVSICLKRWHYYCIW